MCQLTWQFKRGFYTEARERYKKNIYIFFSIRFGECRKCRGSRSSRRRGRISGWRSVSQARFRHYYQSRTCLEKPSRIKERMHWGPPSSLAFSLECVEGGARRARRPDFRISVQYHAGVRRESPFLVDAPPAHLCAVQATNSARTTRQVDKRSHPGSNR